MEELEEEEDILNLETEEERGDTIDKNKEAIETTEDSISDKNL